MRIQDAKGLYIIDFDATKMVAYEKISGSWTKEDYLRYHSEYVSKVGPILGGKSWVKLSDIREYKTSDIADAMEAHTTWMKKTNLKGVAVLVSSAIIKMQLNRASAGQILQKAFDNEKEAAEWLNSL